MKRQNSHEFLNVSEYKTRINFLNNSHSWWIVCADDSQKLRTESCYHRLTGPDGSTEVQLKEPGSVLVSFQFMHVTHNEHTTHLCVTLRELISASSVRAPPIPLNSSSDSSLIG